MTPIARKRNQQGAGLMEVIVGVLAALIIGAILLHLVRLGYAVYKLNTATSGVAQKLKLARELAMNGRQDVSVIFDSEDNKYGIDRNGNRRLDPIEADELPDGVSLADSEVVTFLRSGSLHKGSEQPQILISNARGSHSVSVSSLGAIAID
ncbi:MAG TPA: hypothetical protein VJH03_16015 [Blastocatellia bacterium]|nr:hypothetical protein [Blastocatellia bacterium]